MISIPKKIEYSLELIAYLTKDKGKLVPVSKVAGDLKIPYRFLGQLTIPLRMAGIIEGKEGKGGGYKLMGDWQKKTVYDVFEALGENKKLVKCLEGECCRSHVCRMAKVWKRVEKSFVDELRKIKLQDL